MQLVAWTRRKFSAISERNGPLANPTAGVLLAVIVLNPHYAFMRGAIEDEPSSAPLLKNKGGSAENIAKGRQQIHLL